jgi:hypothetical protein
MALVDVKLRDKVELTLPANENDFIYIKRQVAGGGFTTTDYKIKVRNLIGDALGYANDAAVPSPLEGTTYWDTTLKVLKVYNGATFDDISNAIIKVGTPVNNQLAVWTSAAGLEGESLLTFDGSELQVLSAGVANILIHNNATFDYSEIGSAGMGVNANSGENTQITPGNIFYRGTNFSINIKEPLDSPSGTSTTFDVNLPRRAGEMAMKDIGYTVATLPAGTVGDTAYVTDATTPTYLGALTGGGAVHTPVFRNATIWVSH